MGIDPASLGPAYKKALAAKRDSQHPKRGNSGLEWEFLCHLRQLGVPEALRDQRLPELGKHEADFLWTDTHFYPTADYKGPDIRSLAVFIDGGAHGIKGRYDATLRCVNLCHLLLPPTYTVLRFGHGQIEMGARVVKAWWDGDVDKMVHLIRQRKAKP